MRNKILIAVITVLISFINGFSDVDILIISPERYESKLLEYVEYKEGKGWTTKLVTCENQWGKSTATNTEIKSLIESEYYSNDIEYAILVGDEEDLNMMRFNWSYLGQNKNNAPSDFMFGLIEGNDEYPEVIIGRFAVHNITELSNLINKMKGYKYYDKATLIAHKQDAPGKYQKCCEDIAALSYNNYIPDYTKIYGSNSTVSNNTINNDYNLDDKGVILYRGHGNETAYTWEWSIVDYSYSNSNISYLNNTEQFPVLFNICCSVGAIDYTGGDCFAETYTNSSNGPSLSLAATRATFTDANSELAINIMDEVYNGNYTTYAEAYYSATMAQSTNLYSFAGYNRRIYSWFSDPTLEIRPESSKNPLILLYN